MYDKILMCSGGDDEMAAVSRYSAEIAASYDSNIYILDTVATKEHRIIRIKSDEIDQGQMHAQLDPVAMQTNVADSGEVVSEIQKKDRQTILTECIHTYDIDLAVVGTSQRESLKEYILRRSVLSPIDTAATSVLAIRSDTEVRERYPYDSILVLVNRNNENLKQVDSGAAIAARHDASLHLLSVIDEGILGTSIWSTEVVDQLEAEVSGVMNKAKEIASNTGVSDITTHIVHGSTPMKCKKYASTEDVDLIVTGQSMSKQFNERISRSIPRPVLNC